MTNTTEQVITTPITSSKDEIKKNVSSINDITFELVQSLKPNVKMLDTDDTLSLYCYSSCNDVDNEYVKFCRGLIFDNNNKLVVKAYSYTPEYTADEYDKVKEDLEDIWNKCSFFDAYEGTVIRVFWFGDKWYVATHRRLDAFKSKWASRKTFGELFFSGLKLEYETKPSFASRLNFDGEELGEFEHAFYESLNKEHQYFFLVRPCDDNRVVSNYPDEDYVLHLGTFRNDEEIDEDIGLKKPKKHEFPTLDDLFYYVENADINEIQGVVVFTPNNQVKILNRDYKHYSDIRGNEPSIKFRYLQVRMDRFARKDLMDLYPSYVPIFDKYENIIYDIANNIKNTYVERFIQKKFVKISQEEYLIMKKCHEWHKQDRNNNRLNLQIVIDFVNQQEPTLLNKIIRRYINEERHAALHTEQQE